MVWSACAFLRHQTVCTSRKSSSRSSSRSSSSLFRFRSPCTSDLRPGALIPKASCSSFVRDVRAYSRFCVKSFSIAGSCALCCVVAVGAHSCYSSPLKLAGPQPSFAIWIGVEDGLLQAQEQMAQLRRGRIYGASVEGGAWDLR